MQVRVGNKVFYTVLVLVAIAIIGTFSTSTVDRSKPFHPSSQVLLNSTSQPDANYSLDDDNNGFVDSADYATYADRAGIARIRCLNHRGPPVGAVNSTAWCTDRYPKMMSCQIVSDAGDEFSNVTMTASCASEGPCTAADGVAQFGARSLFDPRTVFAERVLKENATAMIEGCWAYSRDWSQLGVPTYRLDLTCCQAEFIGNANPGDCGNGEVNYGESCDGGTESCTQLGYDYGTANCYPPGHPRQCRWNTTECGYSGGAPPLPGVCFLAGTEVLTPNGPVAIEELHEGDLIVAYDEETGRRTVAPVELRREETRQHYYELNGAIGVTKEHPFAKLVDGEIVWTRVEHLAVGDRIKSLKGVMKVSSLIRYEADSPVKVYNPGVGGPNTYYVIMDGIPVLVHNKDPYKPEPWY